MQNVFKHSIKKNINILNIFKHLKILHYSFYFPHPLTFTTIAFFGIKRNYQILHVQKKRTE